MASHFLDFFSGQAESYARFRPDYPAELFSFISALASSNDLAWDCATGNGQAAIALARHFKKVIATDASQEQISRAFAGENIEYRVSSAESSGLADQSIDLITVAQAVHWFDFERFFTECRRVLKESGVVAIWAYGLSSVSPQIDAIVSRLYHETLGPYWPKQRRYVEEKYESIPFPFEEIPMDKFIIRKVWELEQFLGYLNSWSAVQRYMSRMGKNPVDEIREELGAKWKEQMPVIWPVYLRVGIA